MRLLNIFAVLLLTSVSGAAASIFPIIKDSEFQSGNFKFTIINTSEPIVEITGNTFSNEETVAEVRIPSLVEGPDGTLYKVVSIAEKGLSGLTADKIIFPSSIPDYGPYSLTFAEARNIEFEPGMRVLSPNAFYRSFGRPLGTVTLPEGLICISNGGLYGSFSYFDKLVLPSTLRYIGIFGMGGVTVRYRLVVKAVEPPELADAAFGEGILTHNPEEVPIDFDECVLAVPAESITLYRNHSGWGRFSHIEAMTEEEAAGIYIPATKTHRLGVAGGHGSIEVDGAAGTAIRIADSAGRIVSAFTLDGPRTIRLAAGIYIVGSDMTSVKVIVR